MKSKLFSIGIAVAACMAAAAAGWFILYQQPVSSGTPVQKAPVQKTAPHAAQPDNAITIRLLQVSDQGIAEVQRSVQNDPSPVRLAESIVAEYLKTFPKGSDEPKLLGIFRDRNGLFYIDLSGAFRTHLARSDTAREHALLKALVLSVTMNIPAAQDVRILIDGKEVSALGGHISLLAPLRALAEQASAGSPKQR